MAMTEHILRISIVKPFSKANLLIFPSHLSFISFFSHRATITAVSDATASLCLQQKCERRPSLREVHTGCANNEQSWLFPRACWRSRPRYGIDFLHNAAFPSVPFYCSSSFIRSLRTLLIFLHELTSFCFIELRYVALFHWSALSQDATANNRFVLNLIHSATPHAGEAALSK